MDSRAIEKAKSRLRVAKEAIESLKDAKNFARFSDQWYVFLTSSKNVWTVLEQGAKISPQSTQWFDSKANFRRSDALLKYIYEARNDDEHGLGSSVESLPEVHEFGVVEDGLSRYVEINSPNMRVRVMPAAGSAGSAISFGKRGTGSIIGVQNTSSYKDMTINSLDGKPIGFKWVPEQIILVDVKTRSGKTLSPPQTHIGKPVSDQTPVWVATLALAYLEDLVSEASKLA